MNGLNRKIQIEKKSTTFIKEIFKFVYVLVLCISISGIAYAIPDWNEDGSTISCVWAKDIPGAKFVVGKGTPTVTLNFYSDYSGKSLIKTSNDDHNFYIAVAKKGQYVKLKLKENLMGWVPEKQLQFGPLRNCSLAF